MTTPISAMMVNIDRYVAHRRSLGFAIRTDAYLLRSFARYADLHAPGEPLTVDLALRWAAAPKGTQRVYHAKRLDALRTFARYLAAFEPRTEIPPPGLLGPSFMRSPTAHLHGAGDCGPDPRELGIPALAATRSTHRPEECNRHWVAGLYGVAHRRGAGPEE